MRISKQPQIVMVLLIAAVVIAAFATAIYLQLHPIEVAPSTKTQTLTGTIVSASCPIQPDKKVIALQLSDGTLCFLTNSAGAYFPADAETWFSQYIGKTMTFTGETYTVNGYLHMKNFTQR
jgi:type 1 fimbria pilin